MCVSLFGDQKRVQSSARPTSDPVPLMMHTQYTNQHQSRREYAYHHFYRQSSASFWSEEEDDYDDDRLNNNDFVWQVPEYFDFDNSNSSMSRSPSNFWRKLFSGRMWKQCWGGLQRQPQQPRKASFLNTKPMYPPSGRVSPTCSVSSSYHQSSVPSSSSSSLYEESSSSSSSLCDNRDNEVRNSFASESSVPLPPPTQPQRHRPQKAATLQPQQRRTSRADSISSANSRHRREKALLPPITDIYHSSCTTQQIPLQRVVSALDDGRDDSVVAIVSMNDDDDEDERLFQLSSSSSSASAFYPSAAVTAMERPPDWMYTWAEQSLVVPCSDDENCKESTPPASSNNIEDCPTPPHPVLFTAGWALIRDSSEPLPQHEQVHQDDDDESTATTICCVHVVRPSTTCTPCLWITPKKDDDAPQQYGRPFPCSPGDIQSEANGSIRIGKGLTLRPLWANHDILLHWRLGLDAALRCC